MIKFDITEFYPSILTELLDRSTTFAKSLIDIEGKIINIINHERKSLLLDDSGGWVKTDRNPLSDITMSSFDNAEVCELVGLYFLNKIKPILGTSTVRLYKDDGLAIVHKANSPKLDRLILTCIKWVPGDPGTVFLAAIFTQKMPESSGFMYSFILILE